MAGESESSRATGPPPPPPPSETMSWRCYKRDVKHRNTPNLRYITTLVNSIVASLYFKQFLNVLISEGYLHYIPRVRLY